MQKRDLIKLRPGLKTDEPFIYASWIKGVFYSDGKHRRAHIADFYKYYHDIISKIIESPIAKITIACLQDDDDIILGYSVSEPQTLHWVYVKPAWRGIGLCQDLVPQDTATVTHMTYMGFKVKPNHVEFKPLGSKP